MLSPRLKNGGGVELTLWDPQQLCFGTVALLGRGVMVRVRVMVLYVVMDFSSDNYNFEYGKKATFLIILVIEEGG